MAELRGKMECSLGHTGGNTQCRGHSQGKTQRPTSSKYRWQQEPCIPVRLSCESVGHVNWGQQDSAKDLGGWGTLFLINVDGEINL